MSGSDQAGDDGFAVFGGLDVGKSAHHACALDPTGQRLHDKALPNDETALAEVFQRLAAHGPVLVIVEQPASLTVSDGQSASLSVTATGTAPLAYQWQRGGAAVVDATSAAYTIPAAHPGDSGAIFPVVGTNAGGSITRRGKGPPSCKKSRRENAMVSCLVERQNRWRISNE